MSLAYIGLGSNLGDRRDNLARACAELLKSRDIKLLEQSSIEETEPVDYLSQPLFLNQIILIETAISPEKLLQVLKLIEKKFGRKKTIPKGPRIIDLDILLYDDFIFNSASLKIPHPEIKNRTFVLKHLIEINPDLVDPLTGVLYADILQKKM
jgi:2-amino-4-hydroxy-6-hydroxymethyldihydropteridine diphosphokinase